MREIPLLLLVAIAILGSLVAEPVSAAPPRTYVYELIPEQNQLRYATRESGSWHVVYTRVEGYFQFQINDHGAIVSQGFDLTIAGPFHDSLLEPVDWAPFAPGDALADFLTVDFSDTTGLEVATILFNGAEDHGITKAYVGPDVVGDNSLVSLGKDYYHISRLDVNPTYFFFEAQARAEIGGSFTIFPPTDLSHSVYPPITFPIPGEGDPPYLIYPPVNEIAWLLPNVRLIPEPTSIVLLGTMGVAFGCRRRRGFWARICRR